MLSGFGYNMNMYGSPFQQGSGILGGLNGYGCNANPFTNCYGETNYNALAGYGIFNALLSTASSAIQSCKENREPEVDYNQKISEIKSEISSKREEALEIESDNTVLNTEITNLDESIASLNTQKSTATANLETAENELKKLNSNDTGYAVVKAKYEDVKQNVNEIKEKIEKAEQEKKGAEAKITANSQKADKLDREIKNLEDQKLDYEQAKAKNGGEDCLKAGFYDKEKNPASKNALKTGLSKFKKALKTGDEAEIRKFATIVNEMYTSNPTELNKYKELCENAQTWLKQHPTQQ